MYKNYYTKILKEIDFVLSGVDENEIIDLVGKIIKANKIFVRMLERLGWHDILTIVGVETVKALLSKEIISTIRQPELRERYEFIRSILFGETVSFTGWGDEYYQKIKHTLFSDRWYRSQQTLL